PVRECLGSDVIVHTTSVGSEPLVAFDVAGHTFAVPVEVVREVAALPLIDDLPGAPPGVEGVVDVHGLLVPVLDVAAGTGVGTTTPKLAHHLLVADVGPRVLALHVGDRVAVCAAGT